MDDAERRARQLLAESYREEVPTSEVAKVIEEGFDGVISSRFAIRALTKLLRATSPAPILAREGIGHKPQISAGVDIENDEKEIDLARCSTEVELPQNMRWLPIESAPKDGTWFVICIDERYYEVGCYDPSHFDRYVEVGDGLYRKQPEQIYEWRGFSNFGRATHWMPLPAAPQPREEDHIPDVRNMVHSLAQREPSDKMIEQGLVYLPGISPDALRAAWRIMVDMARQP